MPNSYVKIRSISLIMREIQIKTTVTLYLLDYYERLETASVEEKREPCIVLVGIYTLWKIV